MKQTKNLSFSTILLYILVGLSAVHFVFLMLGLFNVLTPSCLERNSFNYIVAFVLLVLLLAVYILFIFVQTKKNLVIPTWFKIVLCVGLYVFTNVYYYVGLYQTLAGIIVAYVFLAIVLNIFALSIFFNSQKAENGYLKTTPSYAGFSILSISTCLATIFEIIVSVCKIIINQSSSFASLSMIVIDLCTVLLVSIIFCFVFTISLSKSKKAINSCLIKVYKAETSNKRSKTSK